MIADDKGESIWDVTVPTVPTLLQSIAREDGSEGGGLPVHTGRRLERSRLDGLRDVLDRLRDEYGAPVAIGVPRIGGVAQPLYIRSDRAAVLLDVSDPKQARPMQTYAGPAWYEGVAVGWDLMARHDAERGTVDLYVVTAAREI